jgi:hypothetical protein
MGFSGYAAGILGGLSAGQIGAGQGAIQGQVLGQQLDEKRKLLQEQLTQAAFQRQMQKAELAKEGLSIEDPSAPADPGSSTSTLDPTSGSGPGSSLNSLAAATATGQPVGGVAPVQPGNMTQAGVGAVPPSAGPSGAPGGLAGVPQNGGAGGMPPSVGAPMAGAGGGGPGQGRMQIAPGVFYTPNNPQTAMLAMQTAAYRAMHPKFTTSVDQQSGDIITTDNDTGTVNRVHASMDPDKLALAAQDANARTAEANARVVTANAQARIAGLQLGDKYGEQLANRPDMKPLFTAAAAYRDFDTAFQQAQAGNTSALANVLMAYARTENPGSPRLTASLMRMAPNAADPSLAGRLSAFAAKISTGQIPTNQLQQLKSAVDAAREADRVYYNSAVDDAKTHMGGVKDFLNMPTDQTLFGAPRGASSSSTADDLVGQAKQALAAGADPAQVRTRYKALSGGRDFDADAGSK